MSGIAPLRDTYQQGQQVADLILLILMAVSGLAFHVSEQTRVVAAQWHFRCELVF